MKNERWYWKFVAIVILGVAIGFVGAAIEELFYIDMGWISGFAQASAIMWVMFLDDEA